MDEAKRKTKNKSLEEILAEPQPEPKKKKKKKRKCCLFAASGPTATDCKKFLAYGPLMTMNWAAHLFDSVDIAFFGSTKKARTSREAWDKAKQLVALFERDPAKLDMPTEKTVSFHIPDPPREPGKQYKFVAQHIRNGHVLGRATKALHYLKKLGYTDIWLFGHDGGHAYHHELNREPVKRKHDKDRFVVEETLKYLGLRYTFWPRRPEGW